MSLDNLLRVYQSCRTEGSRLRAKHRLLRETRVLLLSYFRRRVIDADAEDLTQAALSIINQELDGFEPVHPQAFRTHVLTVAYNRLRTHWRKEEQRAREREAPIEWTVGPELPSDMIVWSEHFELLRVALARVRSTLRRAFESRMRGETARVLARREGFKTPSMRGRVRRARIAVEAELEKLMNPREETP